MHTIDRWHVENDRSFPTPATSPYLSDEIFANIRQVKDEGIISVSTLSSGNWYRVLLENNITMVINEDGNLAGNLSSSVEQKSTTPKYTGRSPGDYQTQQNGTP